MGEKWREGNDLIPFVNLRNVKWKWEDVYPIDGREYVHFFHDLPRARNFKKWRGGRILKLGLPEALMKDGGVWIDTPFGLKVCGFIPAAWIIGEVQ